MSPSKVCLSLPHFSQNSFSLNIFLKNACTKFLTNMACSLVTDIRSQMNNCMDSLHIKVFFFFIKTLKLKISVNAASSFFSVPFHNNQISCLQFSYPLGDITNLTITSQLLPVLQQSSTTFTETLPILDKPVWYVGTHAYEAHVSKIILLGSLSVYYNLHQTCDVKE
jgi:hypothetical protein